jgi:6,7-dimethyl-8-ribityllumazine synthase
METNTYSDIQAKGMRFGIARARFNEDITGNMLASCLKTLKQAGVDEDMIHVVEVPGVVEIPYVLAEMAERGPYDALITIGAVIKGATPHFDYISKTVIDGMRDIAVGYKIPVIAGVITTLNREQAVERSSDGPLNRGVEAAHVALEMAQLRRSRGWGE